MFDWLKSLFKSKNKTLKSFGITDHACERYLERCKYNPAIGKHITTRNFLEKYVLGLWNKKLFIYLGNNRYFHENMIWIIEVEDETRPLLITIYHVQYYHFKIIKEVKEGNLRIDNPFYP